MPLSDTALRNAKPKEKAYRLFDGEGLYIEVSPRGGKWWRLKYRPGGKEKRLSLGVHQEVGLKEARTKKTAAREQLAQGIDPSPAKKAKAEANTDANSFEAIAREWFAKFSPHWAASHASKTIRRLEINIFPWLGSTPIRDITPPDLLRALRRVEDCGAIETAYRTKQISGQVFRYAIATGRADRDPSADLKGALPPAKIRHYPSIIEPKAIGGLLRAMDGYRGGLVVRCALQLAPLVFVRPGELRHAEWVEINLDSAEWRIPGPKMKMRELHIVPLATQALAVLQELHPLTGNGKYLFPYERSARYPMSENTVNVALRRLGYAKDQMTGHGFRSMGSTLLNEQGWHRDAIERQLAHAERNEIRAAYHYAEHLPERRRMMQAWADYLDGLRGGGNVVPFRKAG